MKGAAKTPAELWARIFGKCRRRIKRELRKCAEQAERAYRRG